MVATTLTEQESNMYVGDKTPTAGFDLDGGSQTPNIGFDLDGDSQTPTTGSNLKEKVEGDLQIAKGTMVTKECQGLQIAIYGGVQQ